MSSNNSTTLRVAGARKTLAEAITFEITKKAKRIIKLSEVLHFALDKGLNPTIIDQFIEELNKREMEQERLAQEKEKGKEKKR